MSRRRVIESLDAHPNRLEILAMIARLPHIADSDLSTLAAQWVNTGVVADARDRALAPDSPLVVDVLSAFDAIEALWEDDANGNTELEADMVDTALKAMRDGIAAAYAKPVLSRSAYAELVRPWRMTFPVDDRIEPDLGDRAGEVKRLLTSFPWLATRCHDAEAAAGWERLCVEAFFGDVDLRRTAREEAWNAAVLTGRRRMWSLLRRSAAIELLRPCPVCRRPDPARAARETDTEITRVLTLCLDAACGLLMADAISTDMLDALHSPVTGLIPEQRRAAH